MSAFNNNSKEATMPKKTFFLITATVSLLFDIVTVQGQSITIPSDSVKGPMCVIIDSVTKTAIPLSPKHSAYNVIVTDGLAEISLTQLFVNYYGVIKDIAYVFPLPHEAAVHAMSMEYRDTVYKAGVQAALSVSSPAGYRRFFVFLTDGFITNESAIIDAIKNHPSSPTIFTFGAGNNLNRYFLDEAAKVGNGVSTEITANEAVAPIVDAVWNKIESPQL